MDFSKLDRLLDDMPGRGIPACEIAVTHDGKLLHRYSVGYSDHAKTKKVSGDTLYRLFSISKTITCTAAMRLIEEGKLSLDDPVSKYIPEYAHLTVEDGAGGVVPCTVPMTVLHLFTMTAGLTYRTDLPSIAAAVQKPGATTLDIVRAMAGDPLLFQPGEHYKYSFCHDVLAAVVEIVSGMRFSEYVQKIILDPLGMKNTGLHPTPEHEARFCEMYTHVTHNGTAVERDLSNGYALAPGYESGGAGFFGCTDDLIKFAAALSLGGTAENGYRLLKTETVEMMEQNRLTDAQLAGFIHHKLHGYGWGLCGRVHMNPVYSLSRSSVGEFGWDGAANALILVDRKKRFALYYAAAVMECSYGFSIMHPLIRNLSYEAVFDT